MNESTHRPLVLSAATNGSRGVTGTYPGLDPFGRLRQVSWVDGTFKQHATSGTHPNKPPIFQERFEYDRVGSGTYTLSESEYNGLSWRTVHRSQSGTPDSTLEHERVMYYDAGWRLIEERVAQHVWGFRYIDDLVLRRWRKASNAWPGPTPQGRPARSAG